MTSACAPATPTPTPLANLDDPISAPGQLDVALREAEVETYASLFLKTGGVSARRFSIYVFPMALSFVVTGVVWQRIFAPGTENRARGINALFGILGLDALTCQRGTIYTRQSQQGMERPVYGRVGRLGERFDRR